MKNINVQTLKVNEKQFFKVWLTLMQPFLQLRNQDMTVLAYLLYYRHVIFQEVSNEAIVDDLLFSTRNRNKIKEDIGIKSYAFNNALTALRKKGLIIGSSLSKKIIPVIEDDFRNFKLVYNVEIIKNEAVQK